MDNYLITTFSLLPFSTPKISSLRSFSFKANNLPSVEPIITYSNAEDKKSEILKDLKGKLEIYRWVNKVNRKSYVGSSVYFSKRLNHHFNGVQSNIQLQQAFFKYSLFNFFVQIF